MADYYELYKDLDWLTEAGYDEHIYRLLNQYVDALYNQRNIKSQEQGLRRALLKWVPAEEVDGMIKAVKEIVADARLKPWQRPSSGIVLQ